MKVARTFALALTLAGCGPGAAPNPNNSCPSDLPTSCPSSPSYMNEVAPLVVTKCGPCHLAASVQQRPLDSYTTLTADRDSVRTQLLVCQMPPTGSPQLSDAERHTLLQWLVCGAQSN